MTRAYKVKHITALGRGLDVLKHLQNHPGCSLHELHNALDLAKPTLLRLLVTLQSSGAVWQRLADRGWLASASLQRRVSRHDHDWLTELASPIILALGQASLWPSLLSVPDTGAMRVVESNNSEAFVDPTPHNPLHFRAPVLRSASGRAWFCFASEPDQRAMLEALKSSDEPGDVIAGEPGQIARIITETRSRGYATRADDFGGLFSITRDQHDDGRTSIALPVYVRDNAVASLNLTWKTRVLSLERGVEMHLGRLRKASEAISAAADRFLVDRPLVD